MLSTEKVSSGSLGPNLEVLLSRVTCQVIYQTSYSYRRGGMSILEGSLTPRYSPPDHLRTFSSLSSGTSRREPPPSSQAVRRGRGRGDIFLYDSLLTCWSRHNSKCPVVTCIWTAAYRWSTWRVLPYNTLHYYQRSAHRECR